MNKLLLFAFVLLLSSSVASSFAEVTNFEQGVAKASMALEAADLVSASVETIEPPSGYAYSKAYMWGGDETSPPKRIIKAITILRNGQMFFIPLSAYADLGNPKEISLEKLPAHGFRLIIGGGDAAGSYNAILDFKKNEISRRKVVSGEFPKEVWEETTFSFNHLKN
jgi:hypothetical protein